MVKIIKNLVATNKYFIKCPYTMTYNSITVHNTENDATAENEVKYMISNSNKVSFHYAIDDKCIVQGIPENRNAYHAGDGANGKGNRESLSIEICYSKSGGDKFLQAERNAAEFIASKLYAKKWGTDRVKRHKDWSGKDCPRLTMKLGWDRFIKMIQAELDKLYEVANRITNIKALQKALIGSYPVDINITGEIDSKTEKVLRTYKYMAKNYTSNAFARWVQTRLKAKGYDIVVDGKYGPASAKVTKRFQEDNKLNIDGIVGYNTVVKLL